MGANSGVWAPYLLLRPAEALLDLPGEQPGAPALGHGGGPGASALAAEEVRRRSIRRAPPERLPLRPAGTRARLRRHPPASALELGFGAFLVLVFHPRVRGCCSSRVLDGVRWQQPPNPAPLVAKRSVWGEKQSWQRGKIPPGCPCIPEEATEEDLQDFPQFPSSRGLSRCPVNPVDFSFS